MKRADLYNLVWERPVTHVAKEYGISDVAIRKIALYGPNNAVRQGLRTNYSMRKA
jgi:hypothetical protein